MNVLFAFIMVIVTAFAEDVTLRDAGNHARNAVGFFIGFGVGLVILTVGICCWKYFETFDLCQRSSKENKYAPPPQTGNSDYN